MSDSPLEWLQQNLTHQIAISCSDPETNYESTYAGTYKQAYLTYKLVCKDGSHQFDVRHRYNEFCELRQELANQFHRFGIIVPPIPPKHVLQINRFDDVFVKERIVGFNLFCEDIVHSPWLRNDNKWKVFVYQSVPYSPANNLGLDQLYGCLVPFQLPSDLNVMKSYMEDIKKEVQVMDIQARLVLKAVRQLQAAEKQITVCQQEVVHNLENWRKAEQAQIRILNGNTMEDEKSPLLQSHESTLTSLRSLTATMKNNTNIVNDLDATLGVTLCALLEYETSTSLAFKEMFVVYDTLLSAVESTQRTISHVRNSKTLKPEKIAETLPPLENQLKEKKATLSMFYKGMYYFTIPFIIRQRAYHYRKYIANYVTMQHTKYHALYHLYLNYYEKNFLQKDYCTSDTTKMFAALGLRADVSAVVEELSQHQMNTEDEDMNMNHLPPQIMSTENQVGQQYVLSAYYGMTGLVARAQEFSTEFEANNRIATENAMRIEAEISEARGREAAEKARLDAEAAAQRDIPIAEAIPVGELDDMVKNHDQ